MLYYFILKALFVRKRHNKKAKFQNLWRRKQPRKQTIITHLVQDLIQPKTTAATAFGKTWRSNLSFFSLSVLSKTVEIENFSWIFISYSEIRAKRMLHLKTKLTFCSKAYLSRPNIKQNAKDLSVFIFIFFLTFVMLQELDTVIPPPKFKSCTRREVPGKK